MTSMRFAISNGGMLVILRPALNVFERYVQTSSASTEAGGVMLGRHLLDSPDVIVDMATEPTRSDKRSRFFFFRSKKHEGLAVERWRATNETSAYLGSWHTHPETHPSPSTVDVNDWERAVRQDSFEGNSLYFVIVGIEHVRAWEMTRMKQLLSLARVD